MKSLTDRHRPRTLADLVGQGPTAYALQSFVDAPYSAGLLFSGPTGVGKTSAAVALAGDLGCRVDEGPFGGWYVVASGDQSADSVRETLRSIRVTPMGSRAGWRVVLIDEADRMAPVVRYIWLSALEDLPPRTVVVMTTNEPDKFEQRLRDRLEAFDFDADGPMHLQDAQYLADRIWTAETGRTDSPRVGDLPGIIDADGRISYRRVVQALQGPLRAVPRVAPADRPRERLDALGNRLDSHAVGGLDTRPLPAAEPEPEPAPFALKARQAPPSLFTGADLRRAMDESAAAKFAALAAYLDSLADRPASVNAVARELGVSFAKAEREINKRWPKCPATV